MFEKFLTSFVISMGTVTFFYLDRNCCYSDTDHLSVKNFEICFISLSCAQLNELNEQILFSCRFMNSNNSILSNIVWSFEFSTLFLPKWLWHASLVAPLRPAMQQLDDKLGRQMSDSSYNGNSGFFCREFVVSIIRFRMTWYGKERVKI